MTVYRHGDSDPHPAFHAIRKRGKGTVVIAKSTGKALSKKPMSRKNALAQLRAVEFHKHNPGAR